MKNTNLFKKYPMVEVTWSDSCGQPGWQRPTEPETMAEDYFLCKSIGYLAKRNKKLIILAGGISQANDFHDLIAIPRKVVHSIRRLK
jgi:hypothetical protein